MFILSHGALVSSRDQLLTGASFLQVWFSDPPGDFESYLVFFLFLIKKINFKISIYRKVAKMVRRFGILLTQLLIVVLITSLMTTGR